MMHAMQPVRTAIVGLGYFGPNLLRNFAAQAACDMVSACDMKQENIDRMQRLYPAVQFTSDYQELLNDATIDLILIATPTTTHFTLAKQALEAGKHVLVEKPMTATVAEAEELNALAAKLGKLIFVDHTFVFAPAVQKMRELVQSGALGELLYYDSARINLGLIQKDTNVLYDLAIHDLSILGTILDLSSIRKITAHGSKHFGAQEEHVHMHMEGANGFHSHVQVSWLSPVKIRQTIVAGTKAMAIYDDTHPSEKLRIYDRGIEHDDTKADPFFPKYRSGDIVIPALSNEETLAIEAKHVLGCILESKTPLVSGAEGASIVRLLEAADASLKNDSLASTL